MSLSGLKTLPKLQNTIASLSAWQSLLGRAGLRVYPYQLGCMIRTAGAANPFDTSGMGEFATNNYVIPCTATAYGSSNLFIPDLTKITRISSVGSVDDEVNLAPLYSLAQGDYLLNIGNDTSSTPLTAPNYDGSTVTMYDDPTGQIAHATKYFLTGSMGQFLGWLKAGTLACDLLISDSSGNPIVVIPMVSPGREIV